MLQEDRVRILNNLVGQTLVALPLSDHPSYDTLNTKLHFRVGVAVYEGAVATDLLERCAISVVVLY